MMRHLLALNWLVSVILLSFFLQNHSAVAAGPPLLIAAVTEKSRASPPKNITDRPDSRAVETIVAELSDEQVRRIRNVTVYLPPEGHQTGSDENHTGAVNAGTSRKQLVEAGAAAAAIAAVQEEEAAKKPKTE